jgi:mannan endo-1,4-beta-mannosidase
MNPWGITSNQGGWGAQWITDHASTQKSVGKPVIIEEYGLTTTDRGMHTFKLAILLLNRRFLINTASTYATWWSAVESSGLSGDLYWQAGTTASGSSYNDGYAIL